MKKLKVILAWCGIFVVLSFLLFQKVATVRQEARRLQGQGRLGQIGLALHHYYTEHGVYPPAVLRDANGKAMHSWRALILPYCYGPDRFNGYDFKEPWDSPQNTAWAKTASELTCFSSPGDPGKEHRWTGFVAIDGSAGGEAKVDPGVLDRAKEPAKIAIVEIHLSGILWLEPRDLTLDEALSGLFQRSPDKTNLNFLATDGKVGTLSRNAITFGKSEVDLLRDWLDDRRQKQNLREKAPPARDAIPQMPQRNLLSFHHLKNASVTPCGV